MIPTRYMPIASSAIGGAGCDACNDDEAEILIPDFLHLKTNTYSKSDHLAKPNFQYEKRQKELEKKRKKEEKLKRKLEKGDAPDSGSEAPETDTDEPEADAGSTAVDPATK